MSESSQGMFYLMNRTLETTRERSSYILHQPISEVAKLQQKLEAAEEAAALEKDKLVLAKNNLESKVMELEAMMKTILTQNQRYQGMANAPVVDRNKPYDPNSGVLLGQPGSMPKWGKSMDNEKCFYCGRMGHFQADCEELKGQLRAGNLKLNPEGKLRLKDGSHIPGFPNGTTIKERIEKHYARRPSQFFYGEYKEEDSMRSQTMPRYTMQYVNLAEDPDRRRARLEKELDLREKEEALELRKLKLEREEKRLEQSGKNTRAAHVLDLLEQLTEEDLAVVNAARPGFT